jgi:hypothetical protein
MDGFTEKLLDALIAVIMFFALIGVIISSTNTAGFAWSAVNIGGTSTNLSFVPYILVLVIVIGAVILVYKHMLRSE